jgi:hypothetical protein
MDLIFCYELLIVWDLRSLQHLLSPSSQKLGIKFLGIHHGGRPTIVGQIVQSLGCWMHTQAHENRGR